MSESLSKYPHIEFARKAINRRAKETRSILESLTLVLKHPDGEHRLYRDEITNEYWQYASAWNWGELPYCFLVPEISAEEWEAEVYVDPDEMMMYICALERLLSVDTVRKMPNLKGHIQSLQKIGSFPPDPHGRWFGPYVRENIIPNFEQVD
ncbi:MAG: hypothetical protein JW936_06550 [Sedimentisphaerales bacterium]|nr:hypothetical protein [Sedimentisphaerales bacterium]